MVWDGGSINYSWGGSRIDCVASDTVEADSDECQEDDDAQNDTHNVPDPEPWSSVVVLVTNEVVMDVSGHE